MEITIKKLTPALLEDYLTFFDSIAFSDNQEWDGCYCTYYHFGRAEGAVYENDPDRKPKLRLKAMTFIRQGLLQGYLAYVDNQVVGWVNTNAKIAYDAIKETPELTAPDDASVKAIVCFTVAPAMRHKGVATALLVKAVEDAQAEGYDAIEAYPEANTENCYLNYHGYKTMFERLGFVVIKASGSHLLMRRSF